MAEFQEYVNNSIQSLKGYNPVNWPEIKADNVVSGSKNGRI